jgi:isocitrate/isopropylmalate dehydrogenase
MDKVNPIGTIMSVKMMMDWMGYDDAAKAIEGAVHKVLEEGKVLTYDLGGTAKCSEVGREIAGKIGSIS